MRQATPDLIAWLAARRGSSDAELLFADCYRFQLSDGAALAFTDVDVPITLNGVLYLANSVLVSGLKYKCSAGLAVDRQQISLAARPTDTIAGVPFLAAVRNGALDGCEITRERAFLSSWSAPPIGSVVLFKGRVSTVDRVGRVAADIAVASDMILLDIEMPRNLYAPCCAHVLFDTGCGLEKAAWSALGLVGAGASASAIPWSGATPAFAQGTIRFTSGLCAGVGATIKSASEGILQLAYPLSASPAEGDGFSASQGCDHTRATCAAKFGNLANFRGFPYVPPPVWAMP